MFVCTSRCPLIISIEKNATATDDERNPKRYEKKRELKDICLVRVFDFELQPCIRNLLLHQQNKKHGVALSALSTLSRKSFVSKTIIRDKTFLSFLGTI